MNRLLITLLCACMLLGTIPLPTDLANAAGSGIPVQSVDEYVLQMMDSADLPGVSIAVLKDGETYVKGYGEADTSRNIPVTPDTLFEVGSNSKAFTGVGLLLLVERGLVDLEAPVTRYLPWLELRTEEGTAEPTVAHFLYQTSGLGSDSVALIDPSTRDTALQDTVRGLSEKPLWYHPGAQFLYSTGNYDVLGAIIEAVSGMSYESYMSAKVLGPLGLRQTSAGRTAGKEVSQGYKPGLVGNRAYEAPVYRGNTPAGYILSSAADLSLWLSYQLTPAAAPPELREAITRAQISDETVKATETPPYTMPFHYGGGWLVFDNGDHSLFTHGGNNPNFSSYILFDPAQQIGVAVLGNRNTTATYAICQGLYALQQGLEPAAAPMDTIDAANVAGRIILMICAVLCLWMIYLCGRDLRLIRKGVRIRRRSSSALYIKTAGFVILAAVAVGVAWYLPKLLFWGYPWRFIVVWAPFTIAPAMILIAITGILFPALRLLKMWFPQRPEVQTDRRAHLRVIEEEVTL
ncbi:beta-lactamase family protein [Paenibacillus albidus]|uniref:serine hydrolase domain-containing protein n=1 Tax=Paenibacillus albidus TaxID=2041023 RepID=UPI001BE9A564|nr:serine hydrolase domain-containing protein [Paenibacillus albidus]MBT2291742.1 beta-lactamase family protein [Paenibacillus albidus]